MYFFTEVSLAYNELYSLPIGVIIGALLGIVGIMCVLALMAAFIAYFKLCKGRQKQCRSNAVRSVPKHSSRIALTSAEFLSEQKSHLYIEAVLGNAQTEEYYITPVSNNIEMCLNESYDPLPCRPKNINPKEDLVNDYLQLQT